MTLIRVGSGAPVPEGFADFFDGSSAAVQRVSFRVNDAATSLTITPPEGTPEVWPLADLREVPDQADRDRLVVTTKDRGLARLTLTDPTYVAVIRHRAPNLAKKPPVRGRARVLGWAGAAVASVLLIVFVLVPVMADQLARILPTKGEEALGEATLGQIQTALGDDFTGFVPTCDAPDGLDALAEMQRVVEAGGIDLPYDLKITVLDHDMVNAFALPGGQVVFFRGMLEAADSPDGIAAVLAHEIGHVAARDPTRIALRSAGSLGVIGLLFGDFAGGAAVLFLVEQLIQADYSREAEAAADQFAIAQMRAAGINPAALGDLFQTLLDEYGDAEGIAAHFTSHPSLGDRIATARAAGEGMGPSDPVLNDDRWRALKNICASAPWPLLPPPVASDP